MPYVGVLFSDHPLNLSLLEKQLGGRITKNKLVFDDFKISKNGRFEVQAPNEKIALTKLRKLVDKTKGLTGVRIVGIGTYNSKGKLQVFFPLLSDAMEFLMNKAQEILLELGLSEDDARPQARVIANEILCGIIRKGKIINPNMVELGLTDYTENSGFIIIDENLQNSMLDSYAKKILERKINVNRKFPIIQRLTHKIKLRKDEIVYGISAALIMESIVRLVVYLMTSMHSEHGTTRIPSSLARHLKKETLTASELGNILKIDEPSALTILNALESLGVMRIVDEPSRTFKKTGVASIPNVLGEARMFRREAAIASSVFHQGFHRDFKSLSEDEWKSDQGIMNQLSKAFLAK